MTRTIKVSDPVHEYLERRRNRDEHTSLDSTLRDVLRDADADWNDPEGEIDYMAGFGAFAGTSTPAYVREEHEALNEDLKEREQRFANRRRGEDEP